MTKKDWSRFSVRMPIHASLESIYNSWCTQEDLEAWFLRTAEFREGNEVKNRFERVEPGDSYLWMWHGYPDTVFEKGKILEMHDRHMIRFSFTEHCAVTVKVYELEGDNIIDLCQEGIPVDEDSKFKLHIGCSTGWTFYLTNLKSLLEGGIDLRNRNEKLTGVLNA
jgi:uncharacterized protein YndB with AHSA1/START domain